MKIRFKLILIFICIILAASLPNSLFILNRQEDRKLALITHQGEINSRILSRATLNIVLMNGGDVSSATVDARDMIYIMAPLSEDGLVYAESVLITSGGDRGTVLAQYIGRQVARHADWPDRISGEAVQELQRRIGFSETSYPSIEGPCYEFISVASPPGSPDLCIGRLIFSKSAVLEPINRLRHQIYVSIAVAVFLASLLGLYFSGFIARPIRNLINGVEKIGGGDLEYRIPVKGRDEVGMLANTFNQLAHVVKLEIDELRSANIELKRMDVLKDEFLANMSHELRTPLYGIIGMSESLIAGAAGPVSSDAVHDLSLIVTSGRRLAVMVNDILDFSKLKHHDIVLNRSPINLFSLAQMVKDIMRPMAEKKSLTIKNLIDPEGVVVDGDEDRLQQILLNLVSNAVKFTEKGGVTISAGTDVLKPGMFVISVSDTGIGIPAEKAGRIFESFEQADGSAERVHGGSGLGLAITKKLVELHGGEIGVETEPGRGSRLFFSVPAATTAVPTARPHRDETRIFKGNEAVFPGAGLAEIRIMQDKVSAVKETKQVLIVDDELINLQVMVNSLRLEGYDVITASSGPEALEKLAINPVNLVLLDVMLPRMSGYEVCRIMRETHSLYELPVLMLTARNKPEDIIAGLESGANDYCAKPVNRQELIARVRSLISLQDSVKLNNELSLIRRDIQIAHDIQKSILNRELPAVEGVTIKLCYEPMEELGGDFYDVRLVAPNMLGVLLADVSGHGIPAAFICAMLKIAYSLHGEDPGDPSAVMRRVGNFMFDYTGGQFITACYACIDLSGKKVRHANAGHWPLLIYRAREGRITMDSDNRMPIGWSSKVEYPTVEADISPGDRIILYTDGIVEARNAKGRMFSDERFHEIIHSCRDCGAAELIDRTMTSVHEWARDRSGRGLEDDATILVMDFQNQPRGDF